MDTRRLRTRRIDLLAALASGSLLLLSACASAGGQPNPTAGPAPSREPWVWLMQHGETIALANGGAVHVDGMDLAVAVAPSPPARTSNVELYLSQDGVPIDSATVRLRYDMVEMGHGPTQLLTAALGGGHYAAPVYFGMTGSYAFHVIAELGGRTSDVELLLQVAP